MDQADDIRLLREYAERRSEAAFSGLVSRHINLVYSVAMRHVGNHAHAQEITQAVFVILARKASALRREIALAGWLFQTARLTAANHMRTEIRRARREQEAFMQSPQTAAHTDGDAHWKQLAPMLDEAIAGLAEKDRNAIVLRYLEGKNLREVGVGLGTNEDAAKMRVSRALEKLRKFFFKRGVALSATALAGAIAANSIQAAPAAMVAGVTAAVMGSSAVTPSTLALAKGTLQLMSSTKINVAIGASVAALLVAGHEWHENTKQTRQVAALQDQLLAEQQKTVSQQTVMDRLQQEKAAVEQEKAAVIAEKQLSEEAAARDLAREKAATAAALAKVSALSNPPEDTAMGALAKLLESPAVQESMRNDALKNAREKYAPLIKQWNLPPDVADKFINIVGSGEVADGKTIVGVLGGQISATDVDKADEEAKQKRNADLQELLGAAGFAQYEQFNKEYDASSAEKDLTAKINTFNDGLGAAGMSDQQMEQLTNVLRANPAVEPPDNVDSPEAFAELSRKMEERTQRVTSQASSFLTPDQLAAWNKSQAAELNDSKAELEAMKAFTGLIKK